jgi:Flp pilus assembly protein TadD
MNKFVKSVCASALVLALSAPVFAAGQGSGWRVTKANTMAYGLMTPAERAEHQAKMRSFKTYDECVAYTAEHHKMMEERAKDKNITLPGFQKGKFGCDNMKEKGFLK